MRILISAGPTREPIDPVRFIGNRSSGRVGESLAQACADAGHETRLLLGPVSAPLSLPEACEVHRFGSTAELLGLLETHFAWCDVLVMAAAVADYTPVEFHPGKLPRSADGKMTITLKPTPDLVATIARGKRDDQRVVAFALEEPGVMEERAQAKMRRKQVDAIVANPLKTMDADTIEPVYFTAQGARIAPGPMPKPAFGTWLLDQLAVTER